MKKILIIHPALVVGGAEVILINYLKILSSLSDKYEVELLLLEDRMNFNRDKIPSNIKVSFILNDVESEFFIYCFLNLGKDNHNYYSSWFNGIKERINQRLLDKINNNSYNIIIDFHRNISSFEHFMRHYDIKNSIPVIYWLHGQYFINSWENAPGEAANSLAKYRKIITISEEMKKNSIHFFNKNSLNDKNIVNIYNPLDQEDIISLSNKEELNDENLLKQDFIVQVSRLDENKNLLEMIDIYASLKEKGINEKLYIIGEGDSLKKKLEEKIISLGLQNDCILLGNRNNPYPFMKKAKLFIHTAKSEGLPTVLIESMICGTPVIAYDCPTGPKEILDNGKYGDLIPLHDKKAFVKAVYEMLKNEILRNHYIELLPEAIERFSMNNIKQQLENLLDNL